MIIPWGTLVNSVVIIIGGTMGLFMGGIIPEKVKSLVFQLFGLCLLAIGLQMVNKSQDLILVILSCVLGGTSGELLKLGHKLESLGDFLKKTVKSKNPMFTDGLITSSVLVCVGAMAIVGSFEEGLGHGRTTVFTKTLIDFFAVMILASRAGSGVVFSFLPVLLYQGGLTMLAQLIQPLMTPAIESCLQSTGGILVMGIGVNMMGLKPQIPLSSVLPALLYAIALGAIFG